VVAQVPGCGRFRGNASKPFIRLADGQSLLQKAWLRGAILPGCVEVMTVTNRELFFKTQDDYHEIGDASKIDLPNSFVLEPFGAIPPRPSPRQPWPLPKSMA
jgi:mannose-1-phosphate guanylyltransferase